MTTTSRVITLKANDVAFENVERWDADTQGSVQSIEKLPDGLTYTEHSFEYEGEDVPYRKYILPELGPKRVLGDFSSSPVIPIKGRNFRVLIDRGFDGSPDYGSPQVEYVTFIETDDPETPSVEWSGEKILRDEIKTYVKQVKYMNENPSTYEPEDVAYYKKRIRDIRDRLKTKEFPTPTEHNIHGQPVFIQGTWLPHMNGRSAYHLLTLETGWGDSGNENYMVALDDDGYPIAVWFEASCC